MTPPPVSLEACLARLYTDPDALEAFLATPEAALAAAGLNEHDTAALRAVDRVGLVMAARSYENKRSRRAASKVAPAAAGAAHSSMADSGEHRPGADQFTVVACKEGAG